MVLVGGGEGACGWCCWGMGRGHVGGWAHQLWLGGLVLVGVRQGGGGALVRGGDRLDALGSNKVPMAGILMRLIRRICLQLCLRGAQPPPQQRERNVAGGS